jgi:hypothetical protein
MTRKQFEGLDQRVRLALDELSSTILLRYPDAQFEVKRGGDDPASIYLLARVDIQETEDILDLVIDRLLELQIEEQIPIHVLPLPLIKQEISSEQTKQKA